jgi:predicted YcjX-like family ATPase
LRGGSRTGKTLTFNALLYNLLGAQHTIDLATGQKNKVELGFTNETRYFRGNPRAEYEKNGETVNKDAVWGGSNVEVKISDAQNTMKVSKKTSSIAQNFAQSLSSKDVRVNQPTIDAVNKETLNRLQSLGYK